MPLPQGDPPETAARPLRILMFAGYYLPHVSGFTIYPQRLAEALVRRGHRVTVLASHHDKSTAYHERMAGVEVVRSPVLVRVRKGAIMPLFWWDVMRLLRSHDLLHLHLPLMEALPATLIGRAVRKPVLMTHHCDIQLPPSLINRLIQRALEAEQTGAAALAQRIVSYTSDYADNSPFLRRFRAKVATVYPPIEVRAPDPGQVAAWRKHVRLQQGPVIGFAGRVSAEKGIYYLLQAFGRLLEKFPRARLVMAGEYRKVLGEAEYERLEPMIRSLADHVVLLGNLSAAQLASFYALCDVLVLPSINATESFGMVQVEAMLCGVPVVVSDLPGVREPVRVTGMGEIVPPRQPRELAEAILRVLTARERYVRPQDWLRSQFNLETTVDRYEEWYRALLGESAVLPEPEISSQEVRCRRAGQANVIASSPSLGRGSPRDI